MTVVAPCWAEYGIDIRHCPKRIKLTGVKSTDSAIR